MSIWCSWESIGWETPDNPTWKRTPDFGGHVRSYATGWSNHYPTTDGKTEQPASVDLAHIPLWCVPGHEGQFDGGVGPWLRLSVHTAEHSYYDGGKPTGEWTLASVVMDEAAVRALAEQLDDWLKRDKAQPVKSRRPAPVGSLEPDQP